MPDEEKSFSYNNQFARSSNETNNIGSFPARLRMLQQSICGK